MAKGLKVTSQVKGGGRVTQHSEAPLRTLAARAIPAARPKENAMTATAHRRSSGTRAVRLVATVLTACLALGGLAALPAAADHQRAPAHYVGLDGNWFNPANWSTRSVPGPHTNVVLDGADNVVIDPARGGPAVAIRDLTMRDAARLTTLPGTVFSARDEHIEDLGVLEHRSTDASGEGEGTLALEGSGTHVLNPSTQSRRIVILKSTVAVTGLVESPTLRVGLGGTARAGAGRVGAGHYATLTATEVALGGRLAVATHYGFTPRVGDTFQVLTAGSATGRFDNAPEGSQVARFGNVGLYITYSGGDGNDVVLTAAPAFDPLGVLPGGFVGYVGTDTNWFNAANWSTGQVPDADDNVVLDAGDVVVIDPARGGPTVAVADLYALGDASLTTLAGTILRSRNEYLGDAAQVAFRSSESHGDTTTVGPGATLELNPTPQSKRTLVLKSSVAATLASTVRFGLGGTRPAVPGAVGRGHYATVRGQEVALGGRLDLRLLYGFVPSDGDEYEIIAAERITGEFEGLPEGALVARTDDGLGLFIHYEEAEPTAGAPVLPKFKVKVVIRVRPTGG